MRKTFRVKPYQDANRPALKYVVNFKENGKRARKFFETKGDAETFVEQKKTELLNHGLEAVEFPTALRVMASQASDRLTPYGKTIMDAVNFYLPHLQAMNRTCNVRELVTELLMTKKQDGASDRYLSDLRSRLGKFAEAMNSKTVAEISTQEIDRWLRTLKAAHATDEKERPKPLSAVGRNNFRRVLVVAFNFAIKRGYCATNPAVGTAKAKEIETAVGILTVDQTAALLSVCSDELVPSIAIGAFAGLRRAELERLDWSEIDLEGSLIQVLARKAKSARRRFVRIRPNLDAWIRPLAKHGGPVAPSNYRELLDVVRESAGINNWPQNALRHSFASYALAAENDAAALALELGHTNSNLVFQHYREVVKPKQAERYWNLKPASDAWRKVVARRGSRRWDANEDG